MASHPCAARPRLIASRTAPSAGRTGSVRLHGPLPGAGGDRWCCAQRCKTWWAGRFEGRDGEEPSQTKRTARRSEHWIITEEEPRGGNQDPQAPGANSHLPPASPSVHHCCLQGNDGSSTPRFLHVQMGVRPTLIGDGLHPHPSKEVSCCLTTCMLGAIHPPQLHKPQVLRKLNPPDSNSLSWALPKKGGARHSPGSQISHMHHPPHLLGF